MRIIALNASGRIQDIMNPSKNNNFSVHRTTGDYSTTAGLELDCDGSPPDRRVEDRPYIVYLTRDEVQEIIKVAHAEGMMPLLPS